MEGSHCFKLWNWQYFALAQPRSRRNMWYICLCYELGIYCVKHFKKKKKSVLLKSDLVNTQLTWLLQQSAADHSKNIQLLMISASKMPTMQIVAYNVKFCHEKKGAMMFLQMKRLDGVSKLRLTAVYKTKQQNNRHISSIPVCGF